MLKNQFRDGMGEEDSKSWEIKQRPPNWVMHLAINEMFHKSAGIAKGIGNVVGYEAMQFSKVMSSSKGRDKICALI